MPSDSLSRDTRPRVRFAPSPTGYLHVGGARTALFNWLFARHTGGTFILRIEDTDFERSSGEMVEGILEGMRWLGLNWDEGPYFQSRRLDLYRETAERIMAGGHAYPCFCAPRKGAVSGSGSESGAGAGAGGDCDCRRIPQDEARERRRSGEPAAIRFRVPDAGTTAFEDAVFGRVEFANSELEDFVLLRSDGIPTYHLSVVADDIDMRLTHVIRGADHIPNTPKQILQYQALGVEPPVFAHVPLILGPDRTRLSKRHGATSVTAYREMGLVPEAFRNFLALLGWTPGSIKDEGGRDREIFSSAELISLFTLEGISRSNAVFDSEKLTWLNAEYLRALPVEELSALLLPVFEKAGMKATPDRLLAVTPLIRERIRTLQDAVPVADLFFLPELAPYDPADLIPPKTDRSLALAILERTAEVLKEVPFDPVSIEQALRGAASSLGVKPGPMFQPARVAISGRKNAPPLFESMAVLGREVCLARLRQAAEGLARLSRSSQEASS